MTTPVNLNKARKAKAKAAREQKAKENRARFGQPKAARKLDAARAERQAKLIAAQRLERDRSEDS